MNQMTSLTSEVRDSGVTVVRIHGALDALGTQMVEPEFDQALGDRAQRVVVDMSDVTFMSSSGMALLLVKGKAMRAGGGNLLVAGPSARVLEVFMLAGFHELFEVYRTVEEALVALEGV
jgi:anti-anti-sigma factor